MIIYAIYLYNIPGVPVFDSFFRIVTANCDHTPYSQRIQKNLHRFRNALAYPDALSKRTYDLMGICFFQFVITDIFADKIVHIFLFFPLRHLLCRADKLLYPGCQSLLMLPDLVFLKKIFRYENQVRRIFVVTIFKISYPEYFRMVQPHLEKNIVKLLSGKCRNLNFIR